MHLFYAPDIKETNELPKEEAQHCVKVLRLKEGDKITITDGVGSLYKAEIALANIKNCKVIIHEVIQSDKAWRGSLTIALAPTKNMDRNELFVEKSTEMGIDQFFFINCFHSERKVLKTERIEKTVIAAMKQSLKTLKPKVHEMISFDDFINRPLEGDKFIAHCHPTSTKVELKSAIKQNCPTTILIGPEGDFSEEEVELAMQKGYIPISLSPSRLRTETAGIIAAATFHLKNYIS